ncbi:hypothetical protein niasHT_037213 [Heterodera trifolii]|uniref:Uncharacterized protein n=1 Tax=Heterodera trifolii TaxID=157864 RepID=A0ABD2IFE8_9BILA
MLPMPYQIDEQREHRKMELFIHRRCNCFIEAWFVQPSDSVGSSDLLMPSTVQTNCPPKYVDQIFTTKFTNTEQQIITIEALTDANIKSVTVELLSVIKGLWLARGTFVLNLDIVVINRYFKLRLYNKEFVANIHCFIIRLNGTLFGRLSFPTGDKLAWEAINRIKVKFPDHSKFMFVIAANNAYFRTLRVLIASIKQTFGCKQKIIAYDLESVRQNKEWMDAFKFVCELEWRTFNFSQMVDSHVRNLHSYSWKTFVIAVASKRQNWPSSNAKL